MDVLVTGADGYLGRGIVTKLLDYGSRVYAVGFNTECVDSRAEKIDVDIFSIEDPFFGLGRPDVVLHLAWRDGFIHNSKAHLEDLPKHCAYVDKLINSGLKRLCVMGSMHEVGYFEGAIDEDTPCNPLSAYGIAKNALRQYCQVATVDTDVILQWLRGYYIVSTDVRGSSIFSKLSQAESDGKKLFPFTSGLNKYDFLDYSEFCEYVAKTIMQDKIVGTINICSGKPVSLKSRVERFIKENDYDIRLEYGVFPDRAYDSPAIWGDNSKIAQVLKGGC